MYAPMLLALTLWSTGIARARAVRAADDRELGASALEWAIISAILVTAAVLIGGIVYAVVERKGGEIESCGTDIAPGAEC